MVAIAGRLPPHQGLYQHVNMGRVFKVRPADNMSDALKGIIMGGGKMVGRRSILSGQHHIAMQGRIGAALKDLFANLIGVPEVVKPAAKRRSRQANVSPFSSRSASSRSGRGSPR